MSSLALRDFEAAFWRSLHEGVVDPAVEGVVEPSPTLAPDGRVRIYQEMYFWRLYEVLREDFPATAATLGGEFEAVVRGYVRAHPSEHPSVRHFGRHFAAFLRTQQFEGHPWIADLAALEWARTDVFDAPDETTLTLDDLRVHAPEDFPGLVFTPLRALAVVESAWPVHRAIDPDDHVHLHPEPTVIRVWRKGFAVFHGAMDPFEASGFKGFLTGATFGSLCDVLAREAPDRAAEEAGSLLVRWLEDGLITGASRSIPA